jgi:hypothetical protein
VESVKAGSCERGNEPSLKGRELLEHLSNYQLLKKGSAPYSFLKMALVNAAMNLLGSLKGREFLELSEQLSASQERFCSVESVKAGSCERGNEPSLKGRELLENLSNYQLLKADCSTAIAKGYPSVL